MLLESSIKSAECCEFDQKHRSMKSEDIIRDPTPCLDYLLLQGLTSGGVLRLQQQQYRTAEVF